MATVLVIDDDQTTRAMIGTAVEELGHQATYALDGEEGVKMVRSKPYDVVFMNLAMPKKGGLIAIQEILGEFPGTKLVAVSGKDPEILERAEEYGALKALTKPQQSWCREIPRESLGWRSSRSCWAWPSP